MGDALRWVWPEAKYFPGLGTIAGLVLHEARRIPDTDQVFAFHGFRFEILQRQRNQITSIKVTPLGEEKPESSG